MAILNGMKIITSDKLTEQVEQTRTLSKFERWIEPILHPVTVPFQPWVRDKVETVSVPSRHCLVSGDTVICHPAVFEELLASIPKHPDHTGMTPGLMTRGRI